MKTLLVLLALSLAAPAIAQDYRERLPQDEVIYFLLPDRFENGDPANDRGGIAGDRLAHGYDPTAKGYYHGGDLRGLTRRLDYLQDMGVTAIWLAPIFKNKAVQGPPGQESAGYHGYWVTDFTQVDPHLGANAEFKAFVDAAHAKGMKVYMDIIANHTADVIQYRGCPIQACDYRSIADYPWQRRGGVRGRAINRGFLGDQVRTRENFARLDNPNFAYETFVPPAERDTKVPAWLNDPIWYHNRGNSTFEGESTTYGDFAGLDDLTTENPRVVQGMIEIFGSWIDRFGIDGFRIDTAKHVDSEFWQAFVPAMLERARARGIPNFHIFGEVFTGDVDTALLARHTRVDKLPAVLDFAFSRAVIDTAGGQRGTDLLARLFQDDPLYEGGAATAMQLPTFLGNHDAGRFSMFMKRANPNDTPDTLLARTRLGHAMMLLLRGVPTIYSGDEQGFVSDAGDQDAREDMFASRVAIYNDNDLLGTDRTTAEANFDRAHPLYRTIAELAKLRGRHAALRRGRQVTRAYGKEPGLFAVSRFDPESGKELLIAFNSATTPIRQQVRVEVASSRFATLAGACTSRASAPGSVTVALPALSWTVCAAR